MVVDEIGKEKGKMRQDREIIFINVSTECLNEANLYE